MISLYSLSLIILWYVPIPCRMFLLADYNEKKSAEYISSHLLSSLWTPYNRLQAVPTLIHMKTLVMGETCESAQFRVNEDALCLEKWPDRLKRERTTPQMQPLLNSQRSKLDQLFLISFFNPFVTSNFSRNLLLITYWSWSHYNKPFVELQQSVGLMTSQLLAMGLMRRRMNQSQVVMLNIESLVQANSLELGTQNQYLYCILIIIYINSCWLRQYSLLSYNMYYIILFDSVPTNII